MNRATLLLCLLPAVLTTAARRAYAQAPAVDPELPVIGLDDVEPLRIQPYSNVWRVVRVDVDGTEHPLSTWRDQVSITERDSREVLVREQRADRRAGGGRIYHNEVVRSSLLPLRTMEQEVGQDPYLDLRWPDPGRHVVGHRELLPFNAAPGQQVGAEVDLRFEQPVFDWQLWGVMIAALPLKEGFRGRMLTHVASPIVGSPLMWISIEVAGRETVSIDGGPDVDTWKVEVQAGAPWTLWMARDPGVPPVVQIRIPDGDGSVRWWRPDPEFWADLVSRGG